MHSQDPTRKTPIPTLPASSSNTGAAKTSLLDHFQQTATEHPIMSSVAAGTMILGASLLLRRNLISTTKLSKNIMTALGKSAPELQKNHLITPGGKLSNIYSGIFSPVRETMRSRMTSGLILDKLHDQPESHILGIGHSEGGQNLLRATDKRSIENWSRRQSPIGMFNADGSYDPHSKDALQRQDEFTKKNHDMVKQRVVISTFGSPSASSGKFDPDQSQNFQHKDDYLARILYGNGSLLPNMKGIIVPESGGHDYQNYEPVVDQLTQEFYKKHGSENSVFIHSGGMNTSNKTVAKRVARHYAKLKLY